MIALLLLACQEPASERPEVIRPVRTLVANETGAALRGTFSATAHAGHEASLSFRMAGTVVDIGVKPGDHVEVDAVLARLDTSEVQLRYQQSQAAVQQAQANAQLAERTLDRAEDLYVEDNASAADVESARAQAQSARAGLVSAIRQRDLAGKHVQNAELRAGRRGRIAQVLVAVNENVTAGTPIMVLTPDEALQATVAVPASWIERLEAGVTAEVSFPEVSLVLPARVAEVGGTPQSAGSFPVTVQLLERHANVRPGLVAEVTLSLEASEQAHLELPLSAISEDESGRFVWKVTEGGTVTRVAVSTGQTTGTGLVVEGIAAGDRIVTAGVSKLYEGRRVRVEGP